MIQNIDFAVLDFIQEHLRCGFLDMIFPYITALGNKGYLWIIAALCLICTKTYRKQGIVLLVGLLIGVLVGNLMLKHLIMRPRPCWLRPDMDLLIGIPRDYSFPSGHTLSSACAATILTLTDRRLGWAAIPMAVLIAFSRLYLYVHFPTDILAGGIIGVIIGTALMAVYMKKCERR